MIIAEACGNHNGDINLLYEMVNRAAQAGADFFKIQTFFADDLAPGWEADYERIKKLELDWEMHAKVARWCKEAGITPMTTLYTLDYAPYVYEAGFTWIKVGSPQATNNELIQGLKALGMKVIISTGGRPLKKIKAFHPIEGVLHCVSKYPALPEEANLLRMWDIKKYWGEDVLYGFSDHTDPSCERWDRPAKMAMLLGAFYIEKHFTLLGRSSTKDGPVSIGFGQLEDLCEFDKLPFDRKLVCLMNGRATADLLRGHQSQEEQGLIEKYSKRWKQEF